MLFIYGLNIAPFISIPIKLKPNYNVSTNIFIRLLRSNKKQWGHVDLSHPADITKMKRQLLKQVHQQPATLYYDLKGSSQSSQTIMNN